MKKSLLVLGLAILLAVPCLADYKGNITSGIRTTDFDIKNLTIGSSVTAYSLTLDAGAVAYINVYAKGGDINWTKGGTTTEAYFTTPSGTTYYDHYQVPFEKNTVLKFWSLTTGAVVQVMYGYY